MGKRLNQIFKNISELDPPMNLDFSILQKIELQRKRKIKMELVLSHIGIIGSVLTAIYTGLTFGQKILQSEFWSIMSLIFSDALTVAINWKEFIYSLMETFPVINSVIVLIPIFTFLMSYYFYLNLNNKNSHKLI